MFSTSICTSLYKYLPNAMQVIDVQLSLHYKSLASDVPDVHCDYIALIAVMSNLLFRNLLSLVEIEYN